ncbi:hypothetical protein BGZ95_004916 [Linnemannia exigua]|uniref:F-box domain-containing protein n=1 Tax=Linnemannia exigua TaxID=604196 RepID=A0AAD4DIT3_9FUNG|nr:hypothetical protein BGZ95_004916 [Linnemannia exigua]
MEYAAACERVFVIPELLVLIREHLKKRELLSLMRVSKNFHDVFLPAFYEEVDLRHCSYILSSRTATGSLIMSAPHIRNITLDDEFLTIYSKGVVAYKDTTNSYIHKSVPLPPMDQLSGLSYFSNVDFVLPKDKARYHLIAMHFMRLCWATELSPLLTRLTARRITLNNSHEPGVLARAIGSLVHLRELTIHVESNSVLWTQVLRGLTRHCPALVQDVRLLWTKQEGIYTNVLRLAELDTIDRDEADLPIPQKPFLYLTVLNLEDCHYVKSEDICPFLARCSRLTSLSVPPVAMEDDMPLVANIISTHCTRLQKVYRRNAKREVSEHGSMLGFVVGSVTKNTLQTLLIGSIKSDDPHLCSMIPNHYESLVSIKFPRCRTLPSETILGILQSCVSLEELVVEGNDEFLWESAIPMEEAGGKPWASNRIRVLELAIDLGNIHELYYPEPPEEPSGRQLTRILQLEAFYKRVAAQHRLTSLCLKIADKPEDTTSGQKGRPYENFTFPMMFILGVRNESQQPIRGSGYLELFSALSQLRTLAGSFNSLSFKRGRDVTKAEIDWFRKFWPRIENEYLYTQEYLYTVVKNHVNVVPLRFYLI